MLRQRRKTDYRPDGSVLNQAEFDRRGSENTVVLGFISGPFKDYIKFAFYCMLLAVPLYAITISIMKNDWIMVIIDALIVPIGFVHGLLLIFGFVD
jgi:hypothetical protein